MALPQDGQNANGLTKVTEIPKGKELIFIDPTTNEGGIITLEDLTTQILKNLTSQTFTLDQGNITLIEALNKLNSNRGRMLVVNIPNVTNDVTGNCKYLCSIMEPYTPYTIVGQHGNRMIAYGFTYTKSEDTNYALFSHLRMKLRP